MSASLVGSEMCIRDRRVPRRTLRQSRSRGGPAALPRSWPPTAKQRAPVSYTHLTLPTICSV
eukprot:2201888-Alexandrium_andersonii.AAC.1